MMQMVPIYPQHMVQNQMNPSYPQFATQTGIEEYQQNAAVAVSQQTPAAAVTDPAAQAQFKEQQVYTQAAITANGVEQQTVSIDQTELEGERQAPSVAAAQGSDAAGPKRLHVSNIPFRFREADLRNLLGQFGTILDVEIIFNERGSKGFGFVTFANSADADRAREKLNGTVVEGRKIEVNNATARVMTKKTTTTPTLPTAEYPQCEYHPFGVLPAAALRGVAFTRARARGAYTAAAAAAAFRHPTPLATAATGLPYTPGVYLDPSLAAAYPERYQPYAAGYASAATRYAIPTVATPATYAATGGPVLSSYGREYQAAATGDPYLGHGIGPVPGYGAPILLSPTKLAGFTVAADPASAPKATVYRGGYQRFAPY